MFLNKNGLQILEIENLDRKKNFILNCFTEYFSSEFKISFFHHWYALLGKDAANTYHYLLKTVTSRCSIRQVSCSVQCSRSVASDSLRLYGLQHTRFPCPSPAPGLCSNSGPLSRWCHPAISSSVITFSYCLQSFPASGSFPKSQFFASGGQGIGVSTST